MDVKTLRTKTGLTQKKFAEKFHIGIRTLQSWENGSRRAPDYVKWMIERILELEDKNA